MRNEATGGTSAGEYFARQQRKKCQLQRNKRRNDKKYFSRRQRKRFQQNFCGVRGKRGQNNDEVRVVVFRSECGEVDERRGGNEQEDGAYKRSQDAFGGGRVYARSPNIRFLGALGMRGRDDIDVALGNMGAAISGSRGRGRCSARTA